MDNLQRELDDVKAEMEKLKAECLIKTEIINSLKKDRNEELLKFLETKKQSEKQAHELDLKSEEIYELKKINENLKSSLHEKEIHIAHLSSENKKIQADCADRLLKLEESSREMVLALDELTVRNNHLEQNACDSSKEISGLKERLSVVEKKYSEAEEKAQQARMLIRREDVILQLEEENRSVQDKIKWRNEQFKHLEEAHEKLQDQFRLSKEKWEKERFELLCKISSLQISLDSQTKISEGLQSRLEMCNHALAHAEGKKKLLEAEISEFKSSFKDVFAQCEEKKSEIQQLTALRNEEIAQLRDSLGEKEMLVQELEHKIVHLEQDNQELGNLLKEFREAQIQNAGANSLVSKLRNKLKRLEEVHKNCPSILKSKESQWDCQVEKMEANISTYKSTLTAKEQEIRELQMELEKCYLTIEENHMGLLVFKSELAEVYLKSAKSDKEVPTNENKGMILNSTEQLRERDNCLETIAQKHYMLEAEFEQQKERLEESSKGQLILKEQLLQLENTLKYERSVAFEIQEKLKVEIANKSDDLYQLDCEAQKCKSAAETLKVSCEELQGTCKKMETSLLSQIENEKALKLENENLLCNAKHQERKSKDLQQQITLLEMHNAEGVKEAERYKQENDELVQIVEDKDCCIKDLKKDVAIACLKQESMRKELEDVMLTKLDVEKALELEQKTLLKIKDERHQTTKHFEELATAMEQDLFDALCFSFSKQVEKWVEISMLTEALKNAEYLTKQEIEEKNMRIVELEFEMSSLRENFAHTDELLFHSKQDAEQLQASLDAMKLDVESLMDKQQTMECIITELKFENANLLQEIMKLSTEKEDMLVYVENICGRAGELSTEDVQLMETLENILKHFVDENVTTTDSGVCSKLDASTTDSVSFPPMIKKHEENIDGRLPLREMNSLQM
ncbi:hypothetical protein TanjilG_09000 [Lupinus angustifolius]|uniref:Uncharacterized protein n=1 Tax=Lupinus angustifolius TaxID=3871 RepID=A0A4P1QPL7_LUPAN|nr:PREDICTED: uncharacterized protein At4g38062-like [Lupinus angustifolius]XP_019425989.1 PREDICTED: uncharacterized protein At4g38062-like [Lupinus angustifolius]XP_019425990.1 PREDICTED: uncharacterized protein At4g38062-like [Lupinus angustifolius]OIV91588.1 hypothetical protein TanjilG_09000 [Lupinus angustifolius]